MIDVSESISARQIAADSPSRVTTIALPKGRILKVLAPILEAAGLGAASLLSDDRSLIRHHPDKPIRFLLLKPDDVPTYVEYGAADLGVCGRDVLSERGLDLYQLVDLGIGRCRLVVAAPNGTAPPRGIPRVATKYPRMARDHFARLGVQADVIYVQGSVELAPITGLADVIVDLVETGTTLERNGLSIVSEVAQVTSVLIANRASYKLRHEAIRPIVEALRGAVS